MTMLDAFRSQIGSSFAQGPSPLGRWLNGTLRAADAGTLTVEFLVREEFTNPAGTLHGGVIAAICDDVIGATVFSLGLPQIYSLDQSQCRLPRARTHRRSCHCHDTHRPAGAHNHQHGRRIPARRW